MWPSADPVQGVSARSWYDQARDQGLRIRLTRAILVRLLTLAGALHRSTADALRTTSNSADRRGPHQLNLANHRLRSTIKARGVGSRTRSGSRRSWARKTVLFGDAR
jgi:hypothetical protein